MSLVRKILITVLAATALIATASIAGGATAWASVPGYGLGSGPTAAAAEKAARMDLAGNYRGCTNIGLLYDKMSGSGWIAEVTATCQFAT